MKNPLLATAGFVAIIFLSCAKEEPLPARFWPLAEGNSWTTAESYSWEAATYSDSSNSTTTNTVEPWEEREDGKLVWPVEMSTDTSGSGTGLVVSRNYYYMTEDSVYIYSPKDADNPSAVEPQNLAVNVEWNGKLNLPVKIPNFSTDFNAHFKVVGQESVTVPAGTFNSLIIKIGLPDFSIDSAATQWRAEDIGIVKMNVNFTYTGARIHGTSEMQSKTGF